MEVITIKHSRHGDTTVKVVRETAKAILLAGNASEAWFPKSAIDSDNWVADWFSLGLEHFFLFDAPFAENIEEDHYPGEWNGGWGEDYAMMRNER